MGSQQLLLIVLAMVVVGIAVTVGIIMFNDHSSAQNRDQVANDLVHASSKAQSYKRRPRLLGGGGGSFSGFTIQMVFSTPTNMNGTYTLASVAPEQVIMEGVGNTTGYDGAQPVKVSIVVFQDSMDVNEVN